MAGLDFGRGPNLEPYNRLRIKELEISRDHAGIRWLNGSFFLLDTFSSYGTFLNGRKLREDTLTKLSHLDTLQIGGTVLQAHHHLPCEECHDAIHHLIPTVARPVPDGNLDEAKERRAKRRGVRVKPSILIEVKKPSITIKSIDLRPSRTVKHTVHKPIADSNKGNKMLRLMGWKKGDSIGLGGGIVEPIQAKVKRDKLGLGM